MTQSFLQAAQIGDAGFVPQQQYAETTASNTTAFQSDVVSHFSQIIEQENNRATEKENLLTRVIDFAPKTAGALIAERDATRELTERTKKLWGNHFNRKEGSAYAQKLEDRTHETQVALYKKGLLIRVFSENVRWDELDPETKIGMKRILDNQDPHASTTQDLEKAIPNIPTWYGVAMDRLGVEIPDGKGGTRRIFWNKIPQGTPETAVLKQLWLEGAGQIFVREHIGNSKDGYVDEALIGQVLLPAVEKHIQEENLRDTLAANEAMKKGDEEERFQRGLTSITAAFNSSTDTDLRNDNVTAAFARWNASDGQWYGGGNQGALWFANKFRNMADAGLLTPGQINAASAMLEGKFKGHDGGTHSLGSSIVDGKLKDGYWPSFQKNLEGTIELARKRNLGIKEQKIANDKKNFQVLGGELFGEIMTNGYNDGEKTIPPVGMGNIDVQRDIIPVLKGTHPLSTKYGIEGGWASGWGSPTEFTAKWNPELVTNDVRKMINESKLNNGQRLVTEDLRGLNSQNTAYYKPFVDDPRYPNSDQKTAIDGRIKSRVVDVLKLGGVSGELGEQFKATNSAANSAYWTRFRALIEAQVEPTEARKIAWADMAAGLGTPDEFGPLVAKVNPQSGLVIYDTPTGNEGVSNRNLSIKKDVEALGNDGGLAVHSGILPGTPTVIKDELFGYGQRGTIGPKASAYYQRLAREYNRPGSSKPVNWFVMAQAQYRQIRAQRGLPVTDKDVLYNGIRSVGGIHNKEQFGMIFNPANTKAMSLALLNGTRLNGIDPAEWFTQNAIIGEAEANGGYDAFTFGDKRDSFRTGWFDSNNTYRGYDINNPSATVTQPISSMTILDILEQQKSGLLGNVGIYGLNRSQLELAIKGSGISLDATFNQKTQELLLTGYYRSIVNNGTKSAVGEDVSWLDILTPQDSYTALEQTIPWANRRENLLPALHGAALDLLNVSETPV